MSIYWRVERITMSSGLIHGEAFFRLFRQHPSAKTAGDAGNLYFR